MLDLHVPKIIAYLIERVVIFFFLVQETSRIDGVNMDLFSCLLDMFSVPASYFLLI